MLDLRYIPPQFIDRAWADGADCLKASCDKSGGDITVDQLKLMLSRGERQLAAAMEDDKPVGWVVFGVEQLPNKRVLHVYQETAPNKQLLEYVDKLKEYARANGCSAIRCDAEDGPARLYRTRFGFKEVRTVMECAL